MKRAALLFVTVLFAAALVLSFGNYRRDIDAARTRIAEGSQVAETPCGPIEYADVGAGPPVLMVHGAGGGFDQSLAVGRILIDEGFRMIAMSRFGYLGTPLPADASPSAQADAHACLLDALELERIAVVGASLGAPSTVKFCLRHPRRCSAMVLVVPVLYSPEGPAEFLRQSMAMVRDMPEAMQESNLLAWIATKIGGSMLIETLIGTPYDEFRHADAAERERIVAILNLALPVSARAAGIRNDISLELSRYDLERISAPTLVISTETDLYRTGDVARYTVGQIAGARHLSYTDGGHLWLGHHQEMLGEIAAFLRSTSDADLVPRIRD
jgi:2-hydroxy-6-oxonona-2,4-dienedioate hydrolase